mmetsp:Transcript_48161/g.87062  ORF Transcript_48161/g.87062 Transcript_48161/m.87062 type:complete len:150 (+) Transcript_48161:50-499(+)
MCLSAAQLVVGGARRFKCPARTFGKDLARRSLGLLLRYDRREAYAQTGIVLHRWVFARYASQASKSSDQMGREDIGSKANQAGRSAKHESKPARTDAFDREEAIRGSPIPWLTEWVIETREKFERERKEFEDQELRAKRRNGEQISEGE